QDISQLDDNTIEAIANSCHDLQDLSKSFKLGDRSLYALANGCPDLTKLNISGCSGFSDGALDDGALEYLSGYCRNLKILNLCGCRKAASDKALKAIGNNCDQLQLINLGWCEGVGDGEVMSLAYGCPNLRALDLCGCVLITDDQLKEFPREVSIMKNVHHLNVVVIVGAITVRPHFSIVTKYLPRLLVGLSFLNMFGLGPPQRREDSYFGGSREGGRRGGRSLDNRI
nr:hypothetical protein [Tanacetum cinerariifolium]